MFPRRVIPLIKSIKEVLPSRVWSTPSTENERLAVQLKTAAENFYKQQAMPVISTAISPTKYRDMQDSEQSHHEKEELEEKARLQLLAQKQAEKNFFASKRLLATRFRAQLKDQGNSAKSLILYAEQQREQRDVEKNKAQREVYNTQYQAIQSILNRGITHLFIPNRSTIAELVRKAADNLGLEVMIGFMKIDEHTPAVQAVAKENRIELDSYHNIDAIQKAALKLREERGALAYHPGIGFTAENKHVSQFCEDNDILFVGPSANCMEIFSKKTNAKDWAEKQGLTIPKSYHSHEQDTLESLTKAAEHIGFPVMLKMEVSGGGMGNRIAHNADELQQALNTLPSGSRLTMEEVIPDNAEHIELQFVIFNEKAYFLGVRGCSIQSLVGRFQKDAEYAETNPIHLKDMHNIADNVGPALHKTGYRGPITVEFLVTPDGKKYFIECNTRLQVEHPLTNYTSGIDIVKFGLEAILGRSPLPTLAKRFSHPDSRTIEKDIDDGLRRAVLNQSQKAIRQLRIKASRSLPNFPNEGETSSESINGKVTGTHVPKPSHKGYVQLGVQTGTELNYQDYALDNQIGAIYGYGATLEEATKNAIELAREFSIEINGVKETLNLEMLCFGLEYLQTHKLPETIGVGPLLTKKYAEHMQTINERETYTSRRPHC